MDNGWARAIRPSPFVPNQNEPKTVVHDFAAEKVVEKIVLWGNCLDLIAKKCFEETEKAVWVQNQGLRNSRC